MSSFTGILDLQVLVGPRAGVTKDDVGGTDTTGRLTLTLLLDLLQGGVALAVGVGHEVAWADGCTHPPCIAEMIVNFLTDPQFRSMFSCSQDSATLDPGW